MNGERANAHSSWRKNALSANGAQTAARNYAAFVWNCCRLILRWTRRGKCIVLAVSVRGESGV
jgi:hypothetical protein